VEGNEGRRRGREGGRGRTYLGIVDQPNVGLAFFHRLAEDGYLGREGQREGRRRRGRGGKKCEIFNNVIQ